MDFEEKRKTENRRKDLGLVYMEVGTPYRWGNPRWVTPPDSCKTLIKNISEDDWEIISVKWKWATILIDSILK